MDAPSRFGPRHAPPGPRFVGALIDLVVVAGLSVPAGWLLGLWESVPAVTDRLNTAAALGGELPAGWWATLFGVFIGYRACCWALWRRTVGQAALGLYLTLPPGRAALPLVLLRAVLEAVLGALCGLCYWWIVLTPHEANLADEPLGTRIERAPGRQA